LLKSKITGKISVGQELLRGKAKEKEGAKFANLKRGGAGEKGKSKRVGANDGNPTAQG